MNSNSKKELAITACKVRMGVIEGTHCAKSGHPGGSLSVTDILTYLYFQEMKTDPQNPAWQERDRLVLSKGHTAPALYAVLAQKGFFPVEEHSVIGGLGDAVCAAVNAGSNGCQVVKMGVHDVYGHSGPGGDLITEFGLRAANIVEEALKLL